MHKRDLTGLKFNMLTVESFAYIRDSYAYWNGETKTAAEWCAEKGWNRHIIPERLRKGWSLEKAMTTPRRTRGV